MQRQLIWFCLPLITTTSQSLSALQFHQSQKSKSNGRMLSGITILVSLAMVLFTVFTESYAIAALGAVMLVGGIYLIWNSYRNKPSVVVNAAGITSNVNGLGLISWQHITGFDIADGVNAKFLVVKVKDEQQLLKTVGRGSQALMRTNINKMGSPVVIPASQFDADLEDVRSQIEGYWAELNGKEAS